MNPANASPGGAPRASSSRSSESHTRSTGAQSEATPRSALQHTRWGRCEEEAPAPPAPPPVQGASNEEPRTGVVRRVTLRSRPTPDAPRSAQAPAERRERKNESQPAGGSSDWRCLEAWGQPSKERRQRRSAKVTIVQLSTNGDLIRQNGPDAWLPEAGDFMQRMSRLLAHGLGFERCRSVCLKGASSVLALTEAGENRVVAVAGPVRSMANVLRRAGLE